MSAERIGVVPFAPSLLLTDHRCLNVLQRCLGIMHPEEGCALLIGERNLTAPWRLSTVWPCCNAWRGNAEGPGDMVQRCSRFAIDPREQIAAQRWARRRACQMLGVAHSHPETSAQPSLHDRRWGEPERLMLIRSGQGELRAWWLGRHREIHPITITITSSIWDTQDHGEAAGSEC